MIVAKDGETVLEGNHRLRAYHTFGIKRVKVIVVDIDKPFQVGQVIIPTPHVMKFFSKLQEEKLV